MGDDHRPPAAVQLELGAVGGAALESVQRAEAAARDGQQLGVVGGGERADQAEAELVRERVGERLVALRVVALVVDECQFGELGLLQPQLAQARPDQRERGRELGGVIAVARVGPVAERHVAVERDAEREPNQAQVVAALLGVPALGERVAFVARVDEGGEVGRVVDERAQVELIAADRARDDLCLGLRDRLL